MWLFGGGGAPPATEPEPAAPEYLCATRGRAAFRPQLFWQRVLPEHEVSVALEIRLGMSGDGVNWARLKSAAEEVPGDGDYARSCARLVPDSESRGDGTAVSAILRAAATWGDDPDRVRSVLCSCYCTAVCCSEALAEAAACGHASALQALLDAGAPPLSVGATRFGKTPLHLACEGGHEPAAKALLDAAATQGGVRALMACCDGAGRTAVELAQQNEMGPMARRLVSHGAELLACAGAEQLAESAEATVSADEPTD